MTTTITNPETKEVCLIIVNEYAQAAKMMREILSPYSESHLLRIYNELSEFEKQI